ncbi:MAG TPA: PASTA domain-containing protein [Gemmatimonadales bacterium]|nr:PASTA domain-containing protein [Gemmatimonadales bacterium]
MRIRRHLPPLTEWRLPAFAAAPELRRWGLGVLGALVAGYLTAYLILFPAPLLHGHQVVPRVLGLSLQEASAQVRQAGLTVQDGGAEPHPTAPQGTIIWQDPPPGVGAPAELRVTLVASDGPPKIPVPDVAGLDGALAQRLIAAAGLTVAGVDSVQAAAPRGIAMVTRPPATSVLAPGAPVTVVVSRGAPTIGVPDLLGLSQADARTRLEVDGLALGTVTRRRTGDANPGTVVAQTPAAGTLAAPGTVVDIVVARSPQ